MGKELTASGAMYGCKIPRLDSFFEILLDLFQTIQDPQLGIEELSYRLIELLVVLN